MNKPFADSCQQNQEPILNVIQPLLKECQTVLEIGSGTGQHAVYFAEKMPHLRWQTSDRTEYHQGINL
jgi:tRNA G46 methylase TrmB